MNKIIYHNGQVVCLNKNNEIHEAVLVEEGKIKAVGSNQEILASQENTTLYDLDGKTMLPGFIDPHGHILAVAQSKIMPSFSEVTTLEDFQQVLKDSLADNPPPGDQWLLGIGYDNSKFPNSQHPTKDLLDAVSTEYPIFVTHASGHIATANSRALELFGYVGDNYEVPEGGIVQTIPGTNEPNGVLEETAYLAPEKKACIISPSPKAILQSLSNVQTLYASHGITTSQDASIDNGTQQLAMGAANYNLLKLDVIGYAIQPNTKELMNGKDTFTANYFNHYKLLGAKMWLDGSPQAKTAWLTKPYHEVPAGESADYRGYGTQPDESVIDYLTMCIDNNYQVNAHCNGDAASDQFIRCYKAALEKSGNKKDLRPVMVHCQTIREDQLDEMKELGMLATFFLDHIWYWGDYHYESVLGPERANRISPANSALKRGINFTLHQDPPVVMPDMILALHNAVNRTTQSGRVLGEDQRIPVLEALKAITINGAYQYFEEDIKGTIESGKLADLVILDRNPLTTPSKELRDIIVLETFKEGTSIFKK